jgi:hypothetical protein
MSPIKIKYRKQNLDQGNRHKMDVPLLTLLAHESTSKSRKLLKKYGKPDAVNHIDLENRLANLYETSPDMGVIDKELAEIHPHTEFIINALDLVPRAELDKLKAVEKNTETNKTSSANALEVNLPNADNNINNKLLTLGVVAIVAMTGLAITTLLIKKI